MKALTISNSISQRSTIQFNYDDFLNKFLSIRDCKPDTLNNYRKSLDQFNSWLKLNTINQPVHVDIKEYKNYLISKPVVRIKNGARVQETLSIFTVNSYMVALKVFFKFLNDVHLYPDITTQIKLINRPEGHVRNALTLQEISSIYQEIKKNKSKIKRLRDKALFDLLLSTALRKSEVRNLNINDFDKKDGYSGVYVLRKKRSVKTFKKIPVDVMKSINNYLKCRGVLQNNDPVFISLSRNGTSGKRMSGVSLSGLFKKYMRKIGLDSSRYCFHSIRHSSITMYKHAIEKGGKVVDLFEYKNFSGHKQTNTLELYIHDDNQMKSEAEVQVCNYIKSECVV